MFIKWRAREDGPIIAYDMGLQWRRTLERNEVVQIADRARLSGAAADIPRDHMRAFARADLIFKATDRSGNETYVAVEISYTADERDVTRATRHAEYLTRFTGTPAYAAIASVHTDNRIADIMTEDTPQPHGSAPETKVFWSRLPELDPANQAVLTFIVIPAKAGTPKGSPLGNPEVWSVANVAIAMIVYMPEISNVNRT